MTNYYHIIRNLRRSQGMSQVELAKQLGVSRQTIVAVESGRSQPSLQLAIGFANVLNSELNSIFNEFIDADNQPKIINYEEEKPMTNISVWNPIKEINELHSELDRLFSDSFSNEARSIVPAINVHESDSSIEMNAAVPGFKEDEVDIEVSNNMLTIKGEKKEQESEKGKNWIRKEFAHQSFERSFKLSEDIDQDKIIAKLTDGVLKITLPKIAPAKPSVKKIELKNN